MTPHKKTVSEKVADILRPRGWLVFDINKDTANGPDMTIARNGKSYRVEIKTACRGTRSWLTKPVGKSGSKCDLIIIVLPNGEIILQPMEDHLKLCSKGGSRFISRLVEVSMCFGMGSTD